MTPNSDDEMVYEVDDDDNVVREVRRGELTDKGLRHRSVAILCRNPEGRILVHRRAAAKRVAPRQYDMFVAGMVAAGESYDESAVRECAEEIGAEGVELLRVGRFRFDDDAIPQWTAVYETVVAGPIVPQESEIEWYAFLTDEEVAASLTEWPYCRDSLELYQRAFTLARKPGPADRA